jgi:hypothetical protein
VEFPIPKDPYALRASSRIIEHGIVLCNEDQEKWTGVTVRIWGTYHAQYVDRMKRISAGDCASFDYADFAEPSWKKMQMPPNETAKTIEILTTSPSYGYAELKPQGK